MPCGALSGHDFGFPPRVMFVADKVDASGIRISEVTGFADAPECKMPRADHSGVSRSTLHHCAHSQHSLTLKAQSQQYLTPFEEKAMVEFVLQMADLGTPTRIK